MTLCVGRVFGGLRRGARPAACIRGEAGGHSGAKPPKTRPYENHWSV